jgi:hypothetical protein
MSTPPDAPRPSPPRTKSAGRVRLTAEQVGAYRTAYEHFNKALFAGELPDVLLNFSRSETTAHELNLNPEHLGEGSPREVAAALVHEMCHVWRLRNGKPPRRSYHDRTWAEKMVSIGLTPRAPDGKMTGVTVHTLVNDVGAFVDAFAALPGADLLRWSSDGGELRKRVDESKVKYSCGCSNAWGKPGLAMQCLRCGKAFTVADGG